MDELDEQACIALNEATWNQNLAVGFIVASVLLLFPAPLHLPGKGLAAALTLGVAIPVWSWGLLGATVLGVAIPVRLLMWWRKFGGMSPTVNEISRARRLNRFALVVWATCPVVVLLWHYGPWSPDRPHGMQLGTVLIFIVMPVIGLGLIGLALSAHDKNMRAGAEKKTARPYLVDRWLVDLAFSLPRNEWNAKARALIEEHGGELSFRVNSDGNVTITDVAAMGGRAFMKLQGVMFGPVWLKPRYDAAGDLPEAVDIISFVEPGAISSDHQSQFRLRYMMEDAIGRDLHLKVHVVRHPIQQVDVLTATFTRVASAS